MSFIEADYKLSFTEGQFLIIEGYRGNGIVRMIHRPILLSEMGNGYDHPGISLERFTVVQ
jgi:hypothetical protein